MSNRSLFKGAAPAFELPASRGTSGQVLFAPTSNTVAAAWGAIPAPTPDPPPEVVDVSLTFNGGTVGATGMYIWQTGMTRDVGGTTQHQHQAWLPAITATGLTTAGGTLTATVAGLAAPAATSAIVEVASPNPTPTKHECRAATLVGTALTIHYGALEAAADTASFTSATFTWWA